MLSWWPSHWARGEVTNFAKHWAPTPSSPHLSGANPMAISNEETSTKDNRSYSQRHSCLHPSEHLYATSSTIWQQKDLPIWSQLFQPSWSCTDSHCFFSSFSSLSFSGLSAPGNVGNVACGGAVFATLAPSLVSSSLCAQLLASVGHLTKRVDILSVTLHKLDFYDFFSNEMALYNIILGIFRGF